MLAEARNAALIPAWLQHIDSQSARAAFCYLVGLAAASADFSCYAQQKGAVRDFRFYLTNTHEMPYAFIPAKQWLLFYFRLPAVRSRHFDPQVLQSKFADAAPNSTGEWTIRLRTISDVERVWEYIVNAGTSANERN